MNERDDTQDQEQVSRLLAAAAGPSSDEPRMPDDVAQRLDDVLAGLVSERASRPGDEVAGVTELGPRRRKRWPQLLVAAAAVSVLGIGLGNVMGGGGHNEQADSSAGRAVQSEERPEAEDEAAPAPTSEGSIDRSGEPADADKPVAGSLDTRRLQRLRSGSLAVDVQQIEDFDLAVPVGGTRRELAKACAVPETRAGDEWLRVRLDGEEAVLVLREPVEGRRTADVFTCGDAGSPAASTTVDAR